MVYLFDSELSENKSISFALTSIFGVGKSNSIIICKKLGFSKNFKIKNLSKEQIQTLVTLIESFNLILVSDLKKFKSLIIKNLVTIKSYRGLRLKQGLPVRGQRTHTNARTSRKKIKNF
jgi:small subunit ribosomal protein S13